MAPSRRDSFSMAPPIEPLWNPANIACYDEQIFEKVILSLNCRQKILFLGQTRTSGRFAFCPERGN